MRLIVLLSTLVAVFAAFGLFPPDFAIGGLPMPTVATLVAAAGLTYSIVFAYD